MLISANIGQNSNFSNLKIIAKTENHFIPKSGWLIGNSIKAKIQTNSTIPYILNESLGFEDYLEATNIM